MGSTAAALCLVVALVAGAHSQEAEPIDPAIESQCRPYVEKALREFSSADYTSGEKELPHADSSGGEQVESSELIREQYADTSEQHGGSPEEITTAEVVEGSEETPPSRGVTNSAEEIEVTNEAESKEEEPASVEDEARNSEVPAVSVEEEFEGASMEKSQASVDEIQTSTEDVPASSEEGTAEEGTASVEVGVLSAEDGAEGIEEGAESVEEGAESVDEEATSAEEGAASVEERAASVEERAASAEEGAASAEEGAASVEEGAAKGAASEEEGAASVEEGAASVEEGAASVEEGAASAEEGAASAEEGAASTEEGAASAEEGAASAEEGAASAEEGVGSAEEGVGSAEEGVGSAEDGVASAEGAKAGAEDAVTSGDEEEASTEKTADITEEAAASAEEGTASAEEGAASAEQGGASAEEGAASVEEGATSVEEAEASLEETEGSTEETAASAEEAAASEEDAAGRVKDEAASVEVTPAGGEEAAASVEDVAASVEDVAGSVEDASASPEEASASAEEAAASAEEVTISAEEGTASAKEGATRAEGAASMEQAAASAEEATTEDSGTSAEGAPAGGDVGADSAEERVTNTEKEEATSTEGHVTIAESAEESTKRASEEIPEGAEVSIEVPTSEESTTEAEPIPEEELTQAVEIPDKLRPREHIEKILHLDSESAEKELMLGKVADIILRDLKRLYDNAIKPLETLYKYRDLSNRHFGDPEIFSKPLILFMGPWSGGKSSIINYLLDNEYTGTALRTGAEPSPAYFNIVMWGDRSEVLDGTQLAADWTFSGLQKFGQGLLDRLRGLRLPNKLLEKVNIVEIPGILEIRKQVERLFPFNDACQWFIDRADIIFLVYDPAKLDVGPETEAILDQLKGRESQTRIVLNKADQVKPEELMRVQGTLIWNISPLMSSSEPPVMYSASLWSLPYEQGAPVRLLQAQEHAFLQDMRTAIDRRVENKIASARRFAVRVRNHAKMVDCYLTTYYNHKGLFGNRKRVSDDIIERPQDYHIYEGLSTLTNISRYDLPDPDVYRDFFRLNPLYDFSLLSSTCTYFRGCPINRLDVAIAYDLPELVGKYRKSVEETLTQLNTRGQS